MDLDEYAKNSLTINDNPDRFKCILSKHSSKMKSVKRRYLQALPYYIDSREERLAEFEAIGKGADNLSPQNDPYRAPLPTFDSALDPEAIIRAETNKRKFDQLY